MTSEKRQFFRLALPNHSLSYQKIVQIERKTIKFSFILSKHHPTARCRRNAHLAYGNHSVQAIETTTASSNGEKHALPRGSIATALQ